MQTYIPYGRQNISHDDIEAVIKILHSEYLTQGPTVPAFEQAIANYCGVAEAVAVNSATSALHLACLALNIGKNDLVWTTPITFVASANCALYCGAQIDFVDIDPQTYNLNTTALAAKLKIAQTANRLPKAIIPVHLCGQSCDMAAIHKLAQEYGFKIIEDASHAIGGSYDETPVGSCRFSDITVFSFHPVKIITTGEGGMALTNSQDLAMRMRRLRSHGITRAPEEMTHSPDGDWYYQQLELGFNYRMTEIQAALGLSQLNKLDDFVTERNTIANQYTDLLGNLQVVTPYVIPECRSSFHLYVIRLKLKQRKKLHKEIFSAMRSSGIGVNLHYIPIYRQPYYASMGFSPKLFPECEHYYKEAISLPIFPGLTGEEMKRVVFTLEKLLQS